MLKVENVSKVFRSGAFGGKKAKVIHDLDFEVKPGEVVSLIGESGSGKTTVGRMILRLTSVSEGRITFDGEDISALKGAGLKSYYRRVQGVFQDPFSSFNPIFKVGRVFRTIRREFLSDLDAASWEERLTGALNAVGLEHAALDKFPHQMSGGQLQRMLIARALVLDIRLLIADEIISMLDASTRIDVLNLLGDLKRKGLSIIFVTHDLALGNYISDRIIILQKGAIVEMGVTDRVFGDPQHPYTRSLLDAVPHLHERWSDAELKDLGLVKDTVRFGGRLIEHQPEHFVRVYS
ncbi:ABC transporter ATP-binding protein [Pleomorphomonas sp. PLEO]|uniref:ABC transporter ATP-binding protein n=1 Tax=Pleomorphomonas sp. PLEO TaxID=3239306 RepID=UPI00351EC4DD